MEKIPGLRSTFASHSVIRNSAVMLAGSVIGNILAYAYHLVVARRLGPSGYGEFGALMSIFYIINVPSGVIQNGLTKYFSILKARNEPGQSRKLLGTSVLALSAAGAAGFLLTVLFMGPISSFLKIGQPVTILLLYLMFLTFFITVPGISALSGYQKFTSLSVTTNIAAVIRIVLGYAAAGMGVAWTVGANALTNVAGMILWLIPLKFIVRSKPESLTVSPKRALGYAAPMAAAMFGVTALYSLDMVLVKHFFPAHEAGIYSSLTVLGKIIFFASFAVTSVMFPTIAERHEKKVGYRKLLFAGTAVVSAISVAVTAVYFLFPRFTVRLLFGSSYDEAIPYTGTFAIFLSFVTIATFLVQSMLACGKTAVSYLVTAAMLAQAVLIWLYHGSLAQVITTNIAVTGILCLVLFAYSWKTTDG